MEQRGLAHVAFIDLNVAGVRARENGSSNCSLTKCDNIYIIEMCTIKGCSHSSGATCSRNSFICANINYLKTIKMHFNSTMRTSVAVLTFYRYVVA